MDVDNLVGIFSNYGGEGCWQAVKNGDEFSFCFRFLKFTLNYILHVYMIDNTYY